MSGITAEKKKGSHRAFEDLSTFLSCTAEECVFCRTKQLANKEHLQKKHLKEAVYFSDQGKEKFVVACYCKDASTNSKRSHYHCPVCQYRSFSRNFNFTKHLQVVHGITAEKKKGGKDTSLSEDINTGDSSPHVKSPAENLYVCLRCDSTFSEPDHLNRHQSEAHKPSSTSMKCTDVQNGSKNVAGSHRVFEDLSTFLSCTAQECVFCRTKQLANPEHLRNKHLKEAVYFSDQGKEKFVVACYCKDAFTNSKRSHYHCPFCQYRSFSRNFNFTKHLQVVHGITAEKKKGGKDTSLSEDINTGDSSPHVKSPAESLFVCAHCDSTFSELDHLNRHQSETHKPRSTSMKCTDVQNGSKSVAGSHRAFEDLSTFFSCTAEECVFCRTKQLANQEHLRNKHLKEAVYFSDQGKEMFVVACYCKDAFTNSKRSHYHCPVCQYRSFSRNFNFTKHLQHQHGITAEKNKGGNHFRQSNGKTARDRSPHILGLFPCPHCDSSFNASSNLRRHQRDVHSLNSIPIICVDRHTGIFVTPRYDHSPFLPIHIVKSTSPPVFGCELDSCQESMETGRLSGNPSKECEHLLRTRYVKSYTPPAILTLESLKEMERKGLISKEWSEQCELLHGTAAENGVDSVYPILYGDMGYSKRMMFFSVYTDKSDNWCKFGRTRVSFDSVSGKWSCQCGEAGKSHGCLHRMLSMWWIFQESPRLLLPDMEVLERTIRKGIL
ncbi:putative zinc finger protein 840 [Mugil cephalus]|uniref:putative zinc finger protein 840 n=1 Tax=Mugil cephalus TaxID=48193 RepID=UPI001FB65F75|nr:putative zinc finger protein 840 [Mugil cephalus]